MSAQIWFSDARIQGLPVSSAFSIRSSSFVVRYSKSPRIAAQQWSPANNRTNESRIRTILSPRRWERQLSLGINYLAYRFVMEPCMAVVAQSGQILQVFVLAPLIFVSCMVNL